jgi:hypothetical protein
MPHPFDELRPRLELRRRLTRCAQSAPPLRVVLSAPRRHTAPSFLMEASFPKPRGCQGRAFGAPPQAGFAP